MPSRRAEAGVGCGTKVYCLAPIALFVPILRRKVNFAVAQGYQRTRLTLSAFERVELFPKFKNGACVIDGRVEH
jgi:hypothetical protein